MATTADLEARIAELEQRIRTMEAENAVPGAVRSFVDAMFPGDVRQHMRAARKEQLLAMRSFLDHWIEKADETQGSPRRRESITVE
ncbi:MAG TPA: hypothetical protein VF998_04900 [Candidatus Limnocylindria bacterium]